ncbi:MAG TPA: YciI family protein [Gammaproteobacteria bacterium]|nr:YciI family protein [Gammaproteobacteria bacterium]
MSGPKNPRTGGVIISLIDDREQLNIILSEDPFYTQNIADYEIIEFIPTKHHIILKSCFDISE